MRKMNVNIDVVNNSISLLGNKMKTDQSVSGHITMRVEINHDSEIQQNVIVVKDEKTQERDEMEKVMYRLHVKFGHAHSKQISNLIVKSNLLEEFGMKAGEVKQLASKIVEDCKICYNKSERARAPKNCFKRCENFNDCLAIDLTEWFDEHAKQKRIILHMIDEFSRLSIAKYVSDKKLESVANTLMNSWICVFGTPKQVIHDRGGEFNNSKLNSLMGLLGIKVLNTAAYSPFSNGIVERHNVVIKATLTKMNHEYHMSGWGENQAETALAHAIFAKNSMLSIQGYSPLMRACGCNVKLMPRLEDEQIVVNDKWVQQRVNEIVNVRQSFLKAENDVRIKSAIQRQANQIPLDIQVGEEVMYYRDGPRDTKGWRGPARVVSVENKTFTLKHDSQFIAAHGRDIRKFRRDHTFKWGKEPTIKNRNPLMRNAEENNEEESVIKIKRKQATDKQLKRCQFCAAMRTCMSVLTPKTHKDQRNKIPNNLIELGERFFVKSFVCSDCLQVLHQQLTTELFNNSSISDNLLNNLYQIVEKMGSGQKQDYRVVVSCENTDENVIQAFIFNTMQYGFRSVTTNLNEGRVVFMDNIRVEGAAANSENSTLIRTRLAQSKLSMPQSRLDNSTQSLDTSYEEDEEEQIPE